MIDSPTAQQPTFIPKQDKETKTAKTPLPENKIRNKNNSNRGYKETPEETALWTKAREDYISNSELTLRQLSIKHNVNYDTLRGRVAREHWSTLRENTIKPIPSLKSESLAEDDLATVRMTIKRTALEACNTILGIMRGTITKNASIRASTAQDMLDRAGFKQPDNIGQKLQAYTDLVKSITINVGTVVNQAIAQPKSVGTVIEGDFKNISKMNETEIKPEKAGMINAGEMLENTGKTLSENIPIITDTSDAEGTCLK